MNGKTARAIRKITGYRPNMPRNYKAVEAGFKHSLVVDEQASAKAGEPRLKVKSDPVFTYFHNDGARAVYRKTKDDYTKGRIK